MNQKLIADENQLLADVNGDGDKTDYLVTFTPAGGAFSAGRELEAYLFDSICGKNGMRVDGDGDGREGGKRKDIGGEIIERG